MIISIMMILIYIVYLKTKSLTEPCVRGCAAPDRLASFGQDHSVLCNPRNTAYLWNDCLITKKVEAYSILFSLDNIGK